MSEHKLYYDILEVPEGSTNEQIEVAYRQQLSKNSTNVELLKLINFAYQILLGNSANQMDPNENVKDLSQISLQAFESAKNVEKWLQGQSSHDSFFVDIETTDSESTDGSIEIIDKEDVDENLDKINLDKLKIAVKPQTVHNLFCTFEEILQGCTKEITITRKVLDPVTELFTDENKSFQIKVKSGTELGYLYTFPNEGDHVSSFPIVSDLVFILKDLPHPKFKRINNFDIECTIPMTPEQFKHGCELQIPTLEHDPILLTIDEDLIGADLVERFCGRGLPFVNEGKKLRGDLVVKFKVVESVENERNVNELNEQNEVQEIIENGDVQTKSTIEMPQPIEHSLKLTLEEICSGCVKKEIIAQKVIDQDGVEQIESKAITIDVQPGSIAGTSFAFPDENIIFIVQEEPHSIFKRSGFDIEYVAKITSQEAILGCDLHIPTLENAPIDLKVNGGVTPNSIERIAGRGLLNPENGEQGDLLVKFEIIFQQENLQDPPVEHDLYLNKYQIQTGHRKKMKINRKIINSNNEEEFEEKILTIDIKPGTPVGTQITFPRESDQNRGTIPADIIFTIREKSENKPKNAPIEQDLHLSLENILNGCVKRMKITRKIFDEYGNFEEAEEFTAIEIKPGTPEGTKFTFNNLGDEYPDSAPADIFFIVRYKPHPIFTVNGLDVEYSVQKIASDVKKDFRLSIPTLEGSYFDHTFRKVCSENSVIRFPNLGLPIDGNKLQRGDLVVRFEIFPDNRKDPPIEHNLMLSLDDVLHGRSKRMKIKRLVVDQNGAEKEEEKIVTIHVNPGTLTGHKFVYQCEGDQNPGRIAADVVFTSTDKPNETFTRSGCDLIYIAQITESEAIHGCHLEIPTLENGKTHPLTLHKAIEKNTQKRICGKGLPKSFNPKERGDIVVKFEIVKVKNDAFSISSMFSLKKTSKSKNLYNSKANSLQFDSEVLDEPKIDEPNESQNEMCVSREIFTECHQTIITQAESPINDPIFQFLPLHLEENIFHGANLQIKFIRKTFADDKETVVNVEHVVFPIEVQPGTKAGTTYHFPQAGHIIPGQIQRDVVYVASDTPHHLYKRNGVDLEYTAKIQSNQTIPGTKLEIPTIGDHLPLCMVINKQIQFDTVIPLKGYGLPFPDDTSKRGTLFVKFEIIDNDNDSKSSQQVEAPPQIESPDPSSSNRDPPIEYELQLTLLDVLHGCIRSKPFQRSIFNPDGSETVEEETFTIKINPGVPSGSRFRFHQKGHRFPGRIPADIVFKVLDKPDPIFQRNGADLEYTAIVTSEQMKKHLKIKIPTLDEEYLKRKVPSHFTVLTIPEKGLPYPDSEKRGKMVVKFKLNEQISSSKHSSLLCLH